MSLPSPVWKPSSELSSNCVDGVGRRVISTQALAVERAVLKLPNVPRAVFILINAFSFHAARLSRALVGREGVHGSCLWAAR